MANDSPLLGAAPAPVRGKKFLALLAVLLLMGALSTGLWLGAVQFPHFRDQLFAPSVFASLLGCVLFTSVNLMTRWFRWHFLIRRFTPQLITRDSLAVYLATLPAIISPFFVAELVRVWLIRKRFRTPAKYLIPIWLTERFLDFGVLCTAFAFSLNAWFGLAGTLLLAGLAWLLFRRGLRSQPKANVGWITVAALSTTVFAWALPVVALSLTLWLLDSPITLTTSVRAFAGGTLFGGLTGLPLGVSVTGSTMIGELLLAGVPKEAGVLSILVYRAGTAWFAVVLGLGAVVVFRERLLRLWRGQEEAHFDEIAGEYEGEIPAHVRDRLLIKKIRLMDRTLSEHGIARGARGLDLGCGQGWYLAEMAALGYQVDGTDFSAGQLKRAEAHLKRSGDRSATFVQADAQALPFADGSYDFVYSINAIHHMLMPGAQSKTLREIARVLRPGGVFLLNEINTHNPVFRWYMGYLFPLLKKIDEGNEEWVLPTALPKTPGTRWQVEDIQYFTFLPDFIPGKLLDLFAGLEQALENSRFRQFSAHYQACMVKDLPAAAPSRTD